MNTTPTKPDVLGEIINERKKQDEKWGTQNHAQEFWLAILGEEFGEACRAAIEGKPYAYRKELIQMAAVAIAAVECLDRGNFTRESLVRLQQENYHLKKRAFKAAKRRGKPTGEDPEWLPRCTCDPAWKDRELVDPQCHRHIILDYIYLPGIK